MEHTRSRNAYRSRAADAIELGNEPPLSVDGGNNGFVDRRRVSVQWFAGTILTALCGAALMGGAVFTSLDGEANFAALPERVEVALRGALGANNDRLGARKSDRLPTAEEPNFARQVIRVSTITRAGNHEVVRVRPFVRIAGNLSLTSSDLTANIPPFNPQRMLADNSDTNTPEGTPAAEPEAEVAFVMRDLAPMMPKLKIALQSPSDEVLARVREAADWSEKAANHVAVAPDITGIKLAYAGNTPPDPYAGFEARIVPENITLLPKTTTETTGGNAFNEKVVVAKKGDTVLTMLRDLGANADDIASVIRVLNRGRDGGIREGQKLRVLMSPIPGTQPPRLQPVRVIIAGDSSIDAVVALADTGKYVSVDVRNVDTEVAQNSDTSEDENDTSGVRLYQSVYETALRNQIPKPIIEELIKIYSYDVDFQRKVQPGDSFEVLYAGEDEAPAADSRSDVLFAALTVGGETKKFYRFQSPDDGLVDYYDETGKSAKKFLVRKPLVAGIMRSSFGIRRHPILGYTKMHTGVDWAAPSGTPIYAAGNGTIEKVGWESGYGKFILLRHNNGYETAYGHMSAYARGMDEGKRVRQGQVIGFVGSTGLSTGSHVHYEIRINGRFVDPMRIKLPRGRELQGPVMAAFDKERERLDGLMARKPARVATNAPAGR
ncbi:M23 family peptidase [Pseudolabrys taiwanensis]|uniref:M23 family peptidase n=1 Tax=Pseudolabrys taiwanensis TaxID=331696 RepID=A0A346A1J9_9HYPH|nr:M23 family metallopeptidase [Pseudolabrys taiwanensis]AXK83046.1 M23 family peptidase [Pseudolabrys taiwanensis]